MRAYVAELAGTFILVFFGVGSVHAAVLCGAQSGLWQVAVVWGVAVALAIYAFGAASGAHLNPAMTAAFAVFRKFPLRQVPGYMLSQLTGAILAALVLYALFSGMIAHFEADNGITRGAAGSELSGMVYGEYFPNPAMAKVNGWSPEVVTVWTAMLGEFVGTAFLAFFIFAITDTHNNGKPGKKLLPLFIGLSVAIIISIIAPLTQAGLNPARDFGPRLVAWMMGWGDVAIPGPRGGFFTVYILSPIAGGLLGGLLYGLLTDYRRVNPPTIGGVELKYNDDGDAE